jgi:hypothetical protein
MNKPMTDQQRNAAEQAQPGKEYTLGMGNNPQPLSGQQMQALAKNHADALAAIKRDIEMRKWAVDQACGLAGAENSVIIDAVALARSIHAFLVEGVEKA